MAKNNNLPVPARQTGRGRRAVQASLHCALRRVQEQSKSRCPREGTQDHIGEKMDQGCNRQRTGAAGRRHTL